MEAEYVTQYGNITEAGLRAGMRQSRVCGSDCVQMYVKGKTFWVEVSYNGEFWSKSSRSYRIASQVYAAHESLIIKKQRQEEKLAADQAAIEDSSANWMMEAVLELFEDSPDQQHRALGHLAAIAKELAKAEQQVETLSKQLDQAAEVAEYTPDVVRLLGSLDGVEIPGYWGRFIDPAQLKRQLEPHVKLFEEVA